MNLNERAAKLYEKIENVDVFDKYARPERARIKTVTNAYELIDSETNRRWLSLCGYDLEKMSDFERLSAYVDAALLMPDSARRYIFLEELETILGEPVPSDITSAEVWKKGCGRIVDICDKVERYCDKNIANRFTFSPFNADVVDFSTSRIFDLNLCVNELLNRHLSVSFEEWQDIFAKALENSEEVFVVLDLNELEFRRGDHYHAGVIYKKLSEKQAIDKSEYETFLFWLVAFICAKASDKIKLFIDFGGAQKSGEEFISYFMMRNILPETHIAVTQKSVSEIESLCDICVTNKKITLDLVLGIEDKPSDIKNIIETILCHYPAVNLRFSGMKGDSLLTICAHRYCKKAIASAVAELVSETSRAEKIIEKIFSSDK